MKNKDPQIIHVVNQLTYLMLGMSFTTTFKDPRIPIVDVHNIIDTFMTKETMDRIELYYLGKTFTNL